MALEEKTAQKEIKGKNVTIVTSPLTKEEARTMYLYRPPSKYAESRFGGNKMTDDIALLIGGNAKRCHMCQAPTLNRYLTENICPDCDGRSEYNDLDPRAKTR